MFQVGLHMRNRGFAFVVNRNTCAQVWNILNKLCG